MVTVAVTAVPPIGDVGHNVIALRVGGWSVSAALFGKKTPWVASISYVVAAATGFVLIVKVAEVLPGGIVTCAGTETGLKLTRMSAIG